MKTRSVILSSFRSIVGSYRLTISKYHGHISTGNIGHRDTDIYFGVKPCVILTLLCPPNQRGGDILFLVRIPSASASASASALLRFRALSFEPMDGFLPNLHRYTVGRVE